MSLQMAFKICGIALICVGINFGLGGMLPLVIFGVGLGLLFLM